MSAGASTGQRSDAGLTLVELLVATSISGMLAGVIASAFFVGVKTTDTANARLAGSQGAQITRSFFPADVSSASADGPVAAVTVGPLPCTDATPIVATLSWTDRDATATAVRKQAVYSCEVVGTQRNLVRAYTENAVLRGKVVLAYDVLAASATCSPDCTAPRTATLTVTEIGGFTFTITGLRRAQ